MYLSGWYQMILTIKSYVIMQLKLNTIQ